MQRQRNATYELALGHAIYGNDLHGQVCACGNIRNIYMSLKEPVKAVHYYILYRDIVSQYR